MRLLSRQAFERLVSGGELLRRDLHGPKVYQTADGRVVKLFRIKRWWRSSMFYPYSLRFLRNARRLARRGFRCVEVDEVFYCHAIRRHGVIYQRLEGEGLDRLLPEAGKRADELFCRYARLLAELHARGVFFRSPHPGNVLLLADGGLGLIDVGDMRFPPWSLRLEDRRRNFQHLLRSSEFREALRWHPAQAFVDTYLQASGLAADDRNRLRRLLLDDFAAMP